MLNGSPTVELGGNHPPGSGGAVVPNENEEGQLSRTVIMIPDDYRSALRAESRLRKVDMGVIVAELIEGNPRLMRYVEDLRQSRAEDDSKRKGGRK